MIWFVRAGKNIIVIKYFFLMSIYFLKVSYICDVEIFMQIIEKVMVHA